MNQNAIKSMAVLMVVVMAATSFVAVMSFSDTDAADQEYDVDLGKKYSMKVQLIFDGSDAESVIYDFGDGTPTSTEWNPIHEYAEEGVYYITQTVKNSYQGGSESTAVYRVEIMGYPEIHFEENGGSAVDDIEQTAFNVPASQPANPTRSGFTFDGWFTDADCTVPYDWSQGLKKDITLYAGWTQVTQPGAEYWTVTFDPAEGSVGNTILRCEKGGSITLPTPVRDGFTFDGWYDGDEKVGDAGDSYTATSDVDLTAHWTEDEGTAPGQDAGNDGKDGFQIEIWMIIVAAIIVIVIAAVVYYSRS